MIPPCGVPLWVALYFHSSRYPALSRFSISRRKRLSWIFFRRIDIRLDFVQAHPIHGFLRHAGRHGAFVPGYLSVGEQVEFRIEQSSVKILQRQSSAASVSDDTQNGFGVSHFANLLRSGILNHLPPFALWAAFPPSDYLLGSPGG
jgi:hypothetical protein